MSHATSAAEITDQSQSNDGSPTAKPATAISVIAVIRIIQRLFTFKVFITFLYIYKFCVVSGCKSNTFCINSH